MIDYRYLEDSYEAYNSEREDFPPCSLYYSDNECEHAPDKMFGLDHIFLMLTWLFKSCQFPAPTQQIAKSKTASFKNMFRLISDETLWVADGF